MPRANVRIVRDRAGVAVALQLGSTLEQELSWQIGMAKLKAPVRELKAIPGRRFRFDLAWPDEKLACEIQGAVWTGGRHTRGAGAESDAEKFSLAVLEGWRVLVVCKVHIRSGQALQWIESALRRDATGAI
jgi:hypothetical protein